MHERKVGNRDVKIQHGNEKFGEWEGNYKLILRDMQSPQNPQN